MKNLALKGYILPLFLASIAIIIPLLMVRSTFLVGPMLIVLLIAFTCLLLIVKNYAFGIYILMIYGASFTYVGRILQIEFPYGILYDALILFTFLVVVLKERNNFQWKLNEPITVLHIIFYSYFILQAANPHSVSFFAWLDASRSFTLFLLYYIFIHFFNSVARVKNFTYIWIGIAVIAALYGLKQEYFGLSSYEWDFVTKDEMRYNLFFIWGHMRVFSIFNDPTTFGIFLGFCGTGTLLMAFDKIPIPKKIFYLTLTILLFISLSYSGTRTAYALVIAGVSLFIVSNISNTRVLVGSFLIVVIFLGLMIGPFYSGPIMRIRSTFNLTEDPSMAVRDIKRIKLQEYVKTHPIGGGMNTVGNTGLSYSPVHPLAGKYDPDSGYLRLALQMGWIGLFLHLLLSGSVVIMGIRNYFNLKNLQLRLYSMIYASAFFGLSIAHYTQDALYQKPINILVIATFALMIKLKDLDKNVVKV